MYIVKFHELPKIKIKGLKDNHYNYSQNLFVFDNLSSKTLYKLLKQEVKNLFDSKSYFIDSDSKKLKKKDVLPELDNIYYNSINFFTLTNESNTKIARIIISTILYVKEGKDDVLLTIPMKGDKT
jgi:hypothetical protein